MTLFDSVLRLMLRAQASLPLGLSRWLGRCFGSMSDRLNSRASLVTKQNLSLCFPDLTPKELSDLARSSMQHTLMTAFETPAVWLRKPSETLQWISHVENEELIDRAMESERGVVVLLPHLGNWEMFNVYFASKGKMTALYHPPRQDWLKPLMSEIRGDNLVPTNRQGLMTLYKELEAGNVVTVLPDQVPASGDFANFYNEPALTDRLVPRLLRKTGAQAVVCIVYRTKKAFGIRFEEANPLISSTDDSAALLALNSSVEKSMRDHLSQYQWEYKRFRERPAGYKKLYKFDGQPQYYH